MSSASCLQVAAGELAAATRQAFERMHMLFCRRVKRYTTVPHMRDSPSSSLHEAVLHAVALDPLCACVIAEVALPVRISTSAGALVASYTPDQNELRVALRHLPSQLSDAPTSHVPGACCVYVHVCASCQSHYVYRLLLTLLVDL